MMYSIPAILAAYLCGSLPFGFLVARVVMKDDIRRHGSGNIGATNVRRVLGNKWGFLVLLLDAAKGAAPVLLLPGLAYDHSAPGFLHLRVACGIATVVGHMFPVWLKFRGGKGVATALGVVAVLSWQATVAALVVFIATLLISRIVSLASMLAAIAFSVAYFVQWKSAAWTAQSASLTGFCIVVPLLILLRHRSNIFRILRGEEPRLGQKKDDPAGVPSSDRSQAAADEKSDNHANHNGS